MTSRRVVFVHVCRFVILWDEGLRKTKTFSILDVSPLPVSSAVHSVCTDPRGMKILVATKSGDLYEVGVDSLRMPLG